MAGHAKITRKTAPKGIDYAEIYYAEESGQPPVSTGPNIYNSRSPKVSLFADSKITISEEYEKLIFKERSIFLLNLFILAVLGPLVFRYALGSHSDNFPNDWGLGVSTIEWVILIVAFLDAVNTFFRGLPMVSGKPTELESTRSVCCHGHIVIGNCSPFVSEDEAIFLRGLLGKTCTVFNTCAGRHSLRGLYVDTILNEKRLKGEEQRKRLWLAWMKFITSMVQLCIRIQQRNNAELAPEVSQETPQHPPTRRTSRAYTVERYDEISAGGHNNIRISKMETVVPNGLDGSTTESNQHFKNLTMLRNPRSRAATAYTSEEIAGSTPLPMVLESPASRTEESSVGNKTNSISADSSKEFFPKVSTRESSGHTENSSHSAAREDSISTFENPMRSMSISPKGATPSGENGFFPVRDEVTVNVGDIVPLLSFLHHWLEVVKDREWTYNYRNTPSALDSLFLAAPFLEIFDSEDIVDVHQLLIELYDAFTGTPCSDPEDPVSPINPDDLIEIRWILQRADLPDWNIHWQFMSRARLRPLPYDKFTDPPGPKAQFVTTRIKPGAIVYQAVSSRPLSTGDYMDQLLETRRNTYKVIKIENNLATVVPFHQKSASITIADQGILKNPPLAVSKLRLLEMNRGKAGAMNVFAEFLRAKAVQFVQDNEIANPPQILLAVVDARHMLAEPAVFFNDALPFFSVDAKTRKPLKKFGEHKADAPLCMLVQYPQYFTNVTHEDFLDNKNASYYTVWQALRDSGKVCTSSGSNAIWEISNADFQFATTSRIEDTGTSHKYLSNSTTVSMPCFVAYGIAKKTEDYLEAVYRWSTGAVELFWGTAFSKQIIHFLIVTIIVGLFGLACFSPMGGFYWLWFVFIVLAGALASLENYLGHKPMRPLIVSTVIVVNCTNWMGNLLSITWVIIVPVEICFKGELPMSSNLYRAMFWMWTALILRMTNAFMADSMCRIVRKLNPHTAKWNYTMVLWRASQLYACSFAYSFLSFLSGTKSAYNAQFHDADLTMWSSFRVDASMLSTAWSNVRSQPGGIFSGAFLNYLALVAKSTRAELGKPDVLTRWYAVGIFILQFVCIMVSCNITNVNNTTGIFVSLVVCGLNIFLVSDIAMLLFPSLGDILGRPARPEYVFAIVSVIVILSSLAQQSILAGTMLKFLKIY
mmetsp:Transcript_9641/g.14517  ORF Transcript_9641/g.14517 Transcript_9641/m.14517 type:complete len:1159 (+) Transcript_9641:48-3524(+)